MTDTNGDPYTAWALRTAQLSALAANYCDHAEHCEIADQQWILDAAAGLRAVATEVAENEGVNPVAAYARRLGVIERRNVAWSTTSFDGEAACHGATSWRVLQLVQIEHDRTYHPDVIGLSRIEQLRHYAFHVAKLAGALADVVENDAPPANFTTARLPDLLLFGLKLSTVMSQRLSDDAVA